MPVQPQSLPAPDAQPSVPALPVQTELNYAPPPATVENRPAPIWFQRMSLFILVIFCIYLGVIVTVLPWWRSLWDFNGLFLHHPRLWAVMRLGPVRGVISGLGLLDIWIGISEAIHYRDQRP
jgi:hypothetical protein